MDKKTIALYKKIKRKYDLLGENEGHMKNKNIRKAGLTIPEYYILANVLTDAFSSPEGVTYTFYDSVANWCRKNGLKVTEPHDANNVTKVNYTISLF